MSLRSACLINEALSSKLDVCGSKHHSTILTVKTQQDATVYQNFIIPYFK